MPTDCRQFLDRKAVMRRHKTGSLPAGDVLRLHTAGLGQAGRAAGAEGLDDLFDAVHGAD